MQFLPSYLFATLQQDAILGLEALYYVWGCDTLQNAVNLECNGRQLSIRSNLACALMHLRHESQPKLLWVDAICINQTDKDEQSRQVQCMGYI